MADLRALHPPRSVRRVAYDRAACLQVPLVGGLLSRKAPLPSLLGDGASREAAVACVGVTAALIPWRLGLTLV